jgi:hypothetical protein
MRRKKKIPTFSKSSGSNDNNNPTYKNNAGSTINVLVKTINQKEENAQSIQVN